MIDLSAKETMMRDIVRMSRMSGALEMKALIIKAIAKREPQAITHWGIKFLKEIIEEVSQIKVPEEAPLGG